MGEAFPKVTVQKSNHDTKKLLYQKDVHLKHGFEDNKICKKVLQKSIKQEAFGDSPWLIPIRRR